MQRKCHRCDRLYTPTDHTHGVQIVEQANQ